MIDMEKKVCMVQITEVQKTSRLTRPVLEISTSTSEAQRKFSETFSAPMILLQVFSVVSLHI